MSSQPTDISIPSGQGVRSFGRSISIAATVPDSKLSVPNPPSRLGNVVMFHIGRSGSTVLADLLAQHADCFWDSEIYERVFQTLEQQGKVVVAGTVPIRPVRYLAHLMSQTDKPFYGFELKFYHLRLLKVQLVKYLARLDALGFRHFLVLERKNSLRKIVSSLVAQQKKQYHQPLQQKALLTPIRLDVKQLRMDRDVRPLVAFLEAYQERFQRLNQLLAPRNVLRLTYEDDIAPDPQIGNQRVCQFLGIPPQPVQVRLGKSNPFPLTEMIVNFAEVERELRDTPFAWMLHE